MAAFPRPAEISTRGTAEGALPPRGHPNRFCGVCNLAPSRIATEPAPFHAMLLNQVFFLKDLAAAAFAQPTKLP